MARDKNGFTLVELAIVLMIIGLLIGGILKGQEMIENARITSTMSQIRSYDAAVLTFQDGYGVLPGDIVDPLTRLPNCAVANCSTGGNGNNIIGSLNTTDARENNTFWLHLTAANLISGVDINGTWPGSNYTRFNAYPDIALDTKVRIYSTSTAPSASWPDGLYGNYYFLVSANSAGNAVNAVSLGIVERMDFKFDDGKPRVGAVRVQTCDSDTPLIGYETTDDSILCRLVIKSGF